MPKSDNNNNNNIHLYRTEDIRTCLPSPPLPLRHHTPTLDLDSDLDDQHGRPPRRRYSDRGLLVALFPLRSPIELDSVLGRVHHVIAAIEFFAGPPPPQHVTVTPPLSPPPPDRNLSIGGQRKFDIESLLGLGEPTHPVSSSSSSPSSSSSSSSSPSSSSSSSPIAVVSSAVTRCDIDVRDWTRFYANAVRLLATSGGGEQPLLRNHRS